MEYYWILPVVAVAGGIIYATLTSYWKSRSGSADPALARAIAENTAINTAVLAKLNAIDTRLGAVEKTLTDIPA